MPHLSIQIRYNLRVTCKLPFHLFYHQYCCDKLFVLDLDKILFGTTTQSEVIVVCGKISCSFNFLVFYLQKTESRRQNKRKRGKSRRDSLLLYRRMTWLIPSISILSTIAWIINGMSFSHLFSSNFNAQINQIAICLMKNKKKISRLPIFWRDWQETDVIWIICFWFIKKRVDRLG